MAFNRKQKLRDNIEAIRTAFILDRERRTATAEEQAILRKYCGFGGLKCILNPARELTDAVHWAKSDLELFAPTVELHRIIRENSRDDMEYKRYTDSLKASVLTAFYTPQPVTDTIADVLHDRKVRPNLVLEPSAGMGAFISPVLSNNLQAEVTAFEKDLLTGKMLGHLYPQQKIRTEGFERIEKPFLNHFDLAISNIPFGDIAVFDAEYEKKSVMHRIPAKKVHTYFFLKGLDAVRDGGVVAFITSQSVLNTEGNGGTRYLMMKQADLLSAIRLPNNLFTENANTEVGCDLIILQKNINKMDLSEEDMRFTRTVRSNHTGVVTNEYFLDHPERIIHTEAKKDTDPYGKPAMIYTHSGGVEGIAMDLYKMLSEDLSVRLDLERYNGIKGERQEARQEMRQNIAVQTEGIETKRENIHSAAGEPAKAKRENSASVAEERTEVKKESGLPDAGAADRTKREANSVQPKVQAMTGVSQEAQSRQPEAPVMDLYDLFGYTQEERRLAERGLKPERKKGSKSKLKKPVQASLFVLPEDGTGMEADKGKTEAGAAITPEEAKEMEEIIRGTVEVEAAHGISTRGRRPGGRRLSQPRLGNEPAHQRIL